MRKVSLTILLSLCVLATSAYAQTITGSMSGHIQDQQGASVPNANITATEPAKKTINTTKTNGQGDFDIAGLNPGTFIVSVEAAGFKKLDRKNTELFANDKLALASVTIFAVLMMAAIPAVLAPSAAGSIAWVSVAMTGCTGALASMPALPADVFPKNAFASVYGPASMGSGFGGMVFALITGWVVEHYSYTLMFLGFGVIPLICATILWTLTRCERYNASGPA
jgi:MFS family permease